MDSIGAKRSSIIHYWCDSPTESIRFTLAQAKLLGSFPEHRIAFSPSRFNKGHIQAHSIWFRQFISEFPEKSIHICDLTLMSEQAPRYIITEYQNRYVLGPDSGFMHLSVENDGQPYYILPKKEPVLDALKDVYLPGLHTLLANFDLPLSEIFKPKVHMLKPVSLNPIGNDRLWKLTCVFVDPDGNSYFNLNRKEFEERRAGRKVQFIFSDYTMKGLRNGVNDVIEGAIAAYFDEGGRLVMSQNAGNFSLNMGVYENSMVVMEFYEQANSQMG